MGGQISGTSETRVDGSAVQSSATQFQSKLQQAKDQKDSKGSRNNSSNNSSNASGSSSSGGSMLYSTEQHINQCNMTDQDGSGSTSYGGSSHVCEEEDPGQLMSTLSRKTVKSALSDDATQKPSVKTIEEATSRIRTRIDSNNTSNADRSAAEIRLAEKDPVTLSFLQEMNVNVDPKQAGLSESERKLAEKNPLTFGLLQYNNVKIGTNRTGAASVTINGSPVELNEQQQKLFKNGNVGAFANSLLTEVKPDKNTQLLAAATAAARVDYTKQKVETLMGQGKDQEALTTLRYNLDGAFSGAEREAVWKLAGEQTFTQEYFKAEITENSKGYNAQTRMSAVGNYLQKVASVAPPEAVNTALDAVKSEFRPKWLEGNRNPRGSVYGASNGAELYQGISALVEKAPGRADEMADWLTSKDGGGNALLKRLERDDFDAVVEGAKEGHGVRLAQEVNKDLKATADANPVDKGLLWDSDSTEMNRYEDFSEQLEEAEIRDNRLKSTESAKAQFLDFDGSTDETTQLFFDNMKGDTRIGNDVRITSDIELRNIIGKSMGYVPENQDAALQNDYSQDWYAEGTTQRKQIDLVAGWIRREGGEGLSVKSLPFVYASERAGVGKGSLFEVTSAKGGKQIIDGTMADQVMSQAIREGLESKEVQARVEEAGGLNQEILDDVIENARLDPDEDTDGVQWKYDDLEEFYDDNLYDPEGKMYMAQGGGLQDRNGDGHVDISSRAAADTTTWEHVSPWVDTAVGVVGVVGGVVLAIPSAGASLGVSAGAATLLVGGSMAYGLVRSGQELHDMSSHGQEIMTLSNQRARGAWLGIAATAFAGGAIGAGMRGTIQMGRATTIMSNAVGSADEVARSMQLAGSANTWMRAGAASGYTGAAIGVEQTGEQGYMLATQWDNMTPQDRALTFLNLSLGVADVGVGVYAHRLQKVQTRDSQTNKVNAQDEVYNQVAMDIIANGDELPEVFGRVEDGSGDDKVFFPSNGGDPRPVTIQPPEAGMGTGKSREGGSTREAPGAKTPEDQGPVTKEMENEPAHEFEAYDYIPEDQQGQTLSPIRRVDDFLGEIVVPLRRGIQIPFQEKYMSLRESVIADYEKATPEQRESGTFDPRELPKYGEFKADNATVLTARTPEGLNNVMHDVLGHHTGYGRQNGDPAYANTKFTTQDGKEKITPIGSSKEFVSMLAVSGENTRILISSIPQFAGGDFHYTSPTPHNMTIQNVQLLDNRSISDFTNLMARGNSPVFDKKGNYLGKGVELAAKADLSIIGFDFSAKGKQDVVAYNRQHMLDNPGLFVFSGELTGKKENVSPLLGKSAWDLTSPKFQAHLRNAAETGQGIHFHYDWGLPGIKETGGKTGIDTSPGSKRVDAVKTAYENFDEATSVLGRPEFRDVNLVMAHTGIGRYVRPDDTMVTKMVTIRDFKGNVIETKEVTAAQHIHKLYEFFDKVPNARADASWTDFIQSYSDSPQLQEGFIQFVVDNQDRLIFGTDSVSPSSKQQYEQPLHMGSGVMMEIARRDPNALWKLLRQNYEDIVDDSRSRVIDWTARELEKQGRNEDITQMYKMHATLDYHREKMSIRARDEFDQWVSTLGEIDSERGLDRRRNTGVYELLYETLPTPKQQKWAEQVNDADNSGQGNDRIGTTGGELQGDIALRRRGAIQGAVVNTLAAGAATGLAAVGGPSDVTNMAAFTTRSAAQLLQLSYQERFRQLYKDVFGREGEDTDYRIAPKKMNMFMDMIAEAQKPLGISDEDMLRTYAAAGQFWANYNMIKNIEVTPESAARGWTKEQRHLASHQEINRFQITLDRELGLGPSFIDTWDVRGTPGKIASALSFGTFIINDAATVAWFEKNGLDFSTMTSSADTMFHGLFGLGNALATYYQGQMLASGQNNVSPLNYRSMRKLQTVYNTLFTGAAAAWTATDLLTYANQIGSGSIGALDAGAGPVKIALDAILTHALYKLNKEDYKGLTGGQMGDPHRLYEYKKVIFGTLALRTAMEAGLILWKENENEEEKAEEAPAVKK